MSPSHEVFTIDGKTLQSAVGLLSLFVTKGVDPYDVSIAIINACKSLTRKDMDAFANKILPKLDALLDDAGVDTKLLSDDLQLAILTYAFVTYMSLKYNNLDKEKDGLKSESVPQTSLIWHGGGIA